MTRDDLKLWEQQLQPLEPAEGASALLRGDISSYNASVDDVRTALLEPVRRLLEKGPAAEHLGQCLERTVAELAFWRRVLVAVHRDGLRPADASPGFLVSYLLS
jgi:hypothetical protein